MSITQLNGACSALLVGLSDLLGNNAPENLMSPVGGVQSTLDPQNKEGVTMEVLGDNSQGHIKPVRVMWKQRQTTDDVVDERDCDPGTPKPIFEDVFTPNLFSGIKIQIGEERMRTLCDAYSQYVDLKGKTNLSPMELTTKASTIKVMREMAQEILMDIDALRQDINYKFNVAVAANKGAWKGGDTEKSFTVIKAADNALVLTGFNVFKQELKKIGMNGLPIIFGGGNIDLAFGALEIGCCNNAGQDFGKMQKNAGLKYYFDDSDFATIHGNANSFIAYYPKTIQFVPANRYVGSFGTQIGTMTRGIFPDPNMPGISYDLRILPNECGEYYDVFIELNYGFWFAPDTQFKASDRLAGVNGILEGIAVAS